MVLGVWQLQSEQSVLHVDNDSYYVNSTVQEPKRSLVVLGVGSVTTPI